MDYWRREQLGAATGIIAVALMGIGAIIAGPYPAPGSNQNDVLTFLTANRDQLRAQAFLMGAASVLALWFMGSLRSYLRRAEGGTGRLSAVAFGGGVIAALCAALGMVFVVVAAGIGEGSVATAFYDVARHATWLLAFPVATLAGATTLICLRTKVFPMWQIGLGLIATAFAGLSSLAIFYDTGALAPGGGLAFYGLFASAAAWIAVTSAIMIPTLRRPDDTALARRRVTDLGFRAEPLPERRADARRLEDRVIRLRDDRAAEE